MKGRAAFAMQPTGSMYVQGEVTLAERPNLSAVTLSPNAPYGRVGQREWIGTHVGHIMS